MHTLFSATHFSAFFTYAYSHFFLETFKKPFDFIKALRTENPTILDLEKYFLHFLKYIKTSNKLIQFVVLIITSSLLLDNYTPNSYSKCYLS